MAMYESEGVCPSNGFLFFQLEYNSSLERLNRIISDEDWMGSLEPEKRMLLITNWASLKLKKEIRDETMKLLGARIQYMVYDQNDIFWGKDCSIYEVLLGEKAPGNVESVLMGRDIAQYLRRIIPVCKYAEEGKKIRIHDVANPQRISTDICHFEAEWTTDEWSFCKNGLANPNLPLVMKGSRAMFSDSRFLVVIDNLEEVVEMYILRTKQEENLEDPFLKMIEEMGE